MAGEGKPTPPRFSRGKLSGEGGTTRWYRFQPLIINKKVQPHPTVVLITKVLLRYGLKEKTHYFLDARNEMGLIAISGEKKWVDLVASLLEHLEEDQDQIRVKVRVVETLTTRDLQSGIETALDRKTSKNTFFRGFSINHQPKSYLDSVLSPTIPYTGSTIGFGTVEDVDAQGNFVSKSRERVGSVSLALRALGEKQVSDIIAKPELVVVSGGRAEFKIEKKFPYQFVEIRGTSAKVYAKTLDLGVTLLVVPYLVGKNKIHLDVTAKVENQAGFVEIGPGTKMPFTSKRQIKTTVIVPSGFEIVLGGLYQKEYSVVEKGVPLLSEIPILGYLFKSYWQVLKRKELLFFIQPKISQVRTRLFTPVGD
jgi:type II secretory pathway component GspD/PulD (secretin)